MNEINGHPERIIPDETPPGIVAIHLKRYDFARPYVRGKRVLDVACGVGYGSHYLAEVASQVVGLDLDRDAISYARQRYGDRANLQFLQGDAAQLGWVDGWFDVVCSFETIEHLPAVEQYLAEVRRVLAPGGIYLVSTPCAGRSTLRPANPHHVQEWSSADFEALLRRYFGQVSLYSQLRRQTMLASWLKKADVFKLRARLVPIGVTRQVAALSGVREMSQSRMDDISIQLGIHRGASEILAVCRP